MVIDSVEIGGFANIRDVKVVLDDITALIAPNGYGKTTPPTWLCNSATI